MKKLITVVAPMYNEEAVVYKYTEVTLNALKALDGEYDYEILFVHDGAKDNTLQKMCDMQNSFPDVIGIVNLSRNFGLEGAIHAGIRTAKGDAVVIMDADLQDPPSLIPEMVKRWQKGADIVVASRVARTKDNFFKRITAGLYYKVLDFFSGKLKLEKNAANYRLLSRRVVEKLKELPEVNTYFRVNVPFIGMKTDKVEYDRNERAAGKTNYNFGLLVRCALDGLTSISIEPLRKIIYAVPLTAFMVVASIIGMVVVSDEHFALSLLLFVVSLLFFILFVAIAIMAEYIGQIMIEVRHRPASIIYEYKPSNISQGK